MLLALLNSAAYISDGARADIAGSDLMKHAKPYFISPAFAFVAYPNRDSTPFRKFYNIPEAETVVRGTLRYQGFPEFIKALVELGWLDETKKTWLTEGLTWADVTQKTIGAADANERCVLTDTRDRERLREADSTLVTRIKELCTFPDESETTRIIAGLRWVGLFSSEIVKPRGGNLLDTLCAQLETLMKYEPGERDLVMLQHKFVVEWEDGREVNPHTIKNLDFMVFMRLIFRTPSHQRWKPMEAQVDTPRWPSRSVCRVGLRRSLYWTVC